MGVGGQKSEMPEIPETRAAARDDAFEAIIERIKSSGGEIIKDESTPLYTESGMEEFEVGYKRDIQFEINKNEFLLTRKVETHVLSGEGRQKHTEELQSPRINMTLKQKERYGNDWQVIDLDEIF